MCTSQEVASQDITVEELVSDMCGTRSVSPLSPADDVTEETGQRDQCRMGQAALQVDEPASALKPSSTQRKRKRTENFDEELLNHLQKTMTENESFGISVGLTLDRLARPVAAKCKARLMEVIAEFDI